MGVEFDKVLNDVVLQENLTEYIRQRARARSAIQLAEAALNAAKPSMEKDSRYDLAVPELTTEVAEIKTLTDTW